MTVFVRFFTATNPQLTMRVAVDASVAWNSCRILQNIDKWLHIDIDKQYIFVNKPCASVYVSHSQRDANLPVNVLERLLYFLSSLSVWTECDLSADTDLGLFLPFGNLSFTSSVADDDLLRSLSLICRKRNRFPSQNKRNQTKCWLNNDKETPSKAKEL